MHLNKLYFHIFDFEIEVLMKSTFIVILSLLALTACDSGPDHTRGIEVVNGTCKVCHAQGINGAPIIGNKKMWGPRAEQGLETLIEHASNGYGLMPAKGGNESLTQEDISAAIQYMLSRLPE